MKRQIWIGLLILLFVPTLALAFPRVLYVPSGTYPTLQAAIDDANEGDVVIIAPADEPYLTSQGYVINKRITITGVSPEDPCIVASTVIEQEAGGGGWVSKIFRFEWGSTGAVLNGITIRGYHGRGIDGRDGDANDPNRPFDGEPGGGVYGGAIVCYSASPIIKNCVITDCNATGGDGGKGADGVSNPSDPDVDHPDGGNGGWPGRAYGAGMAILNAGPQVINTTFNNCVVNGGNAGDGGDAASGTTGDPKGGRGAGWYYGYPIPSPWEFPGDYDTPSKYSGRGGAVYVGPYSSPEFIDCTFTNNRSKGGTNGICGIDGNEPYRDEPSIHWIIDNVGGAVYCGTGSEAKFINCEFRDNVADINTTLPDGNSNNDAFTGYGGAVAFDEGAKPIFENCRFNGNLASVGGGMYWEESDPNIDDCNFVGNSALHGGGVLFVGSEAEVVRSNFSENEATDGAGLGGAICSVDSDALIVDCQITNNSAGGTGGGVFFAGEDSYPQLTNCLVADNTAGRDGGGVSNNLDSQLTVSNCTIASNAATGVGFPEGYGGGLYCSDGSNTNIIDSILWGNSAQNGSQLGVGASSTVDVSYSDVQGSQSAVYVEPNCILIWDPCNLYTDPFFVTGPLGGYYLSQTDAGQAQQSPCVDAGSDPAWRLGMDMYTTRTDEVFDTSIVDMGYHHSSALIAAPCRVSDLVDDNIINFRDFAVLALNWFRKDCSGDNDWCLGVDFTFDTYVGFDDLLFFAECWLVEDTTPPGPNPSEWAVEPYSNSMTPPYSISMIAKTAVDAWGGDVEYYFECTTNSDYNSVWQKNDPEYTANSLSSGVEYGFKVKARDEGDKETAWSFVGYAVAGADNTAPSPDPMTWATVPYPTSPNSIRMVATSASDLSGVEYYFACTAGGGNDSGWQDSTIYEDTGLEPNTPYSYRVKARDKSTNQNETGWSSILSATTLVAGADVTPPTPNPSEWAVGGEPRKVNRGGSFDWWATMTAATATDPSGVEYKFVCANNSGFSSGWQADTLYEVQIGGQHVYVEFYVITRDLSPQQNQTAPSPTLPAVF